MRAARPCQQGQSRTDVKLNVPALYQFAGEVLRSRPQQGIATNNIRLALGMCSGRRTDHHRKTPAWSLKNWDKHGRRQTCERNHLARAFGRRIGWKPTANLSALSICLKTFTIDTYAELCKHIECTHATTKLAQNNRLHWRQRKLTPNLIRLRTASAKTSRWHLAFKLTHIESGVWPKTFP